MKKHLSQTLASLMIIGALIQHPKIKSKVVLILPPRPKGRDHRVNSEEEKTSHKLHQKKIKQRRNAKKGIYEHKIKYKRRRKND